VKKKVNRTKNRNMS